jgi:hypothetical protein
LAENLMAAMLGLEVASGNDALASHSAIRKSANLMLQFIPGTDFIFSGYSAVPRRDTMFGGGNFDVDDLDDYAVLQRDMQIDGGTRSISEQEAIDIRRVGAQAIQAVYAEMGFPDITDAEVEAAVVAHSSEDMPARDIVADLAAADAFLAGDRSVVDVVAALSTRGFAQTAENLLMMGRQRIAGDYLQPAAIFDRTFTVQSAINDPNDYRGPGTGYRVSGARWDEIMNIRQAKSPRDFIEDRLGSPIDGLDAYGQAKRGGSTEVVVAIGPAFGRVITKTIGGIPHDEVLKAVLTGIAEEGLIGRIVRIWRSSDCAEIGHVGAKLSGSGVSIGIQARGTSIIHRADLARLNNLELFPQSPSMTLETYRAMGRNAARYAAGRITTPVPVTVDNWARLRLIVKTALMHRRETEEIRDLPPEALRLDWEPEV